MREQWGVHNLFWVLCSNMGKPWSLFCVFCSFVGGSKGMCAWSDRKPMFHVHPLGQRFDTFSLRSRRYLAPREWTVFDPPFSIFTEHNHVKASKSHSPRMAPMGRFTGYDRPGWSGPQSGSYSRYAHTCITVFFPLFILGKVYCTLCAMHLVAKGDSLRQHCCGYWYKRKRGDSDEKIFHETKHSMLVKKREEQRNQLPPPPAAPTGGPIFINVCIPLSQPWPLYLCPNRYTSPKRRRKKMNPLRSVPKVTQRLMDFFLKVLSRGISIWTLQERLPWAIFPCQNWMKVCLYTYQFDMSMFLRITNETISAQIRKGG